MNYLKTLAGFVLLFSVATLGAPAIKEGQIIVRLKNTATVAELEARPGVSKVSPLVADLNIYLVSFESMVMSAEASLKSFQASPNVTWAQLDHLVTKRALPNDTDFTKQWSLSNATSRADIRALEAWDISTGGADKKGNDIVVAVVDGGAEITHDDLKENIWVNAGEVQGNGIDDDNNGYIDDIHGWDAFEDDGDVSPDDHATHVSGIIGAKGNNGKMVSGINWNVKIMTVDGAGATSVVLKAYGYVLKNKQLWLESNGQKGANVVATNSSFGVDYADCATGSYPAWNDMYNEMGKVGILSAAATANQNIDIDLKGDVPTGCDSPYIVSVTNTTSSDKRNSGAAFGKTTVDIGAPGTGIYSTVTNNSTRSMTGTSMATPHIAGSVALLHAAASKDFNDFYYANPGEAALTLKEVILNSVDPIADLTDKTVSGGRLNLSRAALTISNFHLTHKE